MIFRAFGKNPSGDRLKRIRQSPHYHNGAFRNIEPTEVIRKNAGFLRMLIDFFNKPASTIPSSLVPVMQNELKEIPAGKSVLVWFGHSSYLISIDGFTILTDPVFSGYASPFSIFGKSFNGTDVFPVDSFPTIDLLIITHDHYDHLDYLTFLRLHNKVKHILTPLGVGSHLEFWGADNRKITELDWWESFSAAANIKLTATPSRHFSGRSFKRAQTLWSSFVLETGKERFFLGGDSGYDRQFKKIGDQFGPFDIALLDCAQYGENWPYIHMQPEQTVQAAIDLQADILLPVHWAKFALSLHPWTEPIERVIKAAGETGLKVITPQIGEFWSLSDPTETTRWWNP